MMPVLLMMGGTSAERAISLQSGEAVAAALKELGRPFQIFDPATDSFDNLPDDHVAFIALHGRGGEDGSLQGLLNLKAIPYTGSGVLACALTLDKIRFKQMLKASDLPTADFVRLSENSDADLVISQLGLPLFVKPAKEGSSLGISKVTHPSTLAQAYKVAAAYHSEVMAERFLPGAEITVGILGDDALPPIRIEAQGEFYDYEAKYLRDDTQYHIPCGLPNAAVTEIQNMALSAFKAVGGRGWGRVDFMLDENAKPHCLEINPSPGMTNHSLVPMASKALGMSFPQLVQAIVDRASIDE